MVICNVQVGALENFRKQSHIEIIKLQHTVDEHSLSNLETVYDLGAKMVEALGKDKMQSGDAIAIDKGALGVVFARVTDLANAHGMAAMVRRLALKKSAPKGHTKDTILLYFICSVVVSSVNDDNEIVDTTPL
ncbi:hypothetical protein Tco_0961826 [Tanacetum coccineum]